MNTIDTKSFKSGNSVAVRFPRNTGLAPDVDLTITPRAGGYWVAPRLDPDESRQRVRQLIEALDALPSVGELQERPEFDVPDRPWLP